VNAFLSKFELRYCLHLAVRAVVERDAILVTPASKKLLKDGSYLKENCRTVLPEKPHPNLSNRIQEVVVWRILIGLDNPDIQDELLLSPDTVREYVSKGYKSLGVSSEIDAFNVLSDWWWMTRFSPALK
jgi:DNA-binding NarL/FixJ family response regulator